MRPDYPEIHIIVGSGRCGTGYLARQLRASMDICYPNEPKFVVPIYRQLRRFGNLEQPANLRRLVERVHSCLRRARVPSDPEQILKRIQEPTYTGVLYAVFQMVAEKRGHSRLGYKDPFDVTHLPFLAQLFPTARFIHIIRDGRDVALSLNKLSWGPTSLYGGARYWAWGVSTCRKDGASLGSRYFEVRLEDLILNTDETAAELGEFINRGNHPEQVRNLIERIDQTKRSSNTQLWKQNMNEKERYLCEAAAGDVLRACGYPTEFGPNATISPLKKAFYLAADFTLHVRNRLKWEVRRALPRPAA